MVQSTNQHCCRLRCAGRSLIPAAPRRATISTVTANRRRSRRSRRHGGHGGPTAATIATVTAATSITGITAAIAVRAAVAAGSLTPDGREGLPGTAWHCQQPRSAAAGLPDAAGPLDYQPPLARRTTSRRWPAGRPTAAAAAEPLARWIGRQCLPQVGRRRPAWRSYFLR